MAAFLMGDFAGFAGLFAGLAAAAAGAAAVFTGGMATLGPTLVLGMPFDSEAARSNLGLACNPKELKPNTASKSTRSPASSEPRLRKPT